jgi:FkbM family methyltransferase
MDFRFLYNRYVRNLRLQDGYRWTFGLGIAREKWLESTILQKRRCLVDVGANVGAWSIPASKFYDEIIAYEPSPRPRNALLRNLRLNNVKNVDVRPYALDFEGGTRDLYTYRNNGHDSFYASRGGFEMTGKRVRVKVTSLDDEKLEPSLIKVDTEGFEINVLKGALGTVNQHHPILVVETHFSKDPDEIERLIPEYGFERFTDKPPDLSQTWLVGKSKSC